MSLIMPKLSNELTQADKASFIKTESGNKISRKSIICGSQNIILGGRTVIDAEAMLRGDLRRVMTSSSSTTSSGSTQKSISATAASVAISIGKSSIIRPRALIRPPSKSFKGQFSYYPMRIGDHVWVGDGAIVEAGSIGNHVYVGKDAVVGAFAIVKDCVVIPDGAVVPPFTHIAPYTLYQEPHRSLVHTISEDDELPESFKQMFQAWIQNIYDTHY